MPLTDDLLAVLNDPAHMWTHALKELSSDARRLFLSLAILPKPVSTDVLQIAHTASDLHRSESFLDSLKPLEDSFVKIDSPYGSIRLVEFRNPSLQDFAYTHLNENTDYLDLLSNHLVFFEQVVGVFTLALAHKNWIYKRSDGLRQISKRKGDPKYPGIKKWVDSKSTQMIETAVDLLDSKRAERYRHIYRSRLTQLMDIAEVYELSSSALRNKKLQDAVDEALNPSYREDANISLRLLGNQRHRRILDLVTGDNSARLMRENMLDKDNWKFAILSKLDVILEMDSQEIWESWGESFADYARQLVFHLGEAEGTDANDIREAILEVTSVSNMLDIDMSEELASLETQRQGFLSHREEDHVENSKSSDEEHDYEDASFKLGQIFSTLL